MGALNPVCHPAGAPAVATPAAETALTVVEAVAAGATTAMDTADEDVQLVEAERPAVAGDKGPAVAGDKGHVEGLDAAGLAAAGLAVGPLQLSQAAWQALVGEVAKRAKVRGAD